MGHYAKPARRQLKVCMQTAQHVLPFGAANQIAEFTVRTTGPVSADQVTAAANLTRREAGKSGCGRF